MEDPRVSWLVRLFMEQLRKDDGLTTDKVRRQPRLIELLVEDGTAEEAAAMLRELVLEMGDGYHARAVRNSLVVSDGRDGIEPRGGPEKRREWATGFNEPAKPKSQLFIPRNVRTHATYEEKGFAELAELIIDREVRRASFERNQETSEDADHSGSKEVNPLKVEKPDGSEVVHKSAQSPRGSQKPTIRDERSRFEKGRQKRLRRLLLAAAGLLVLGLSLFNPIDRLRSPYGFVTSDFLQCRDTEGDTWSRKLSIEAGHIYECYLPLGSAKAPTSGRPNSSAWVEISTQGSQVLVSASIAGRYASTISAKCIFVMKNGVTASYQRGSARIYGAGLPEDGRLLPEAPKKLPLTYGLTVLPGVTLPAAGTNVDYILFKIAAQSGAGDLNVP